MMLIDKCFYFVVPGNSRFEYHSPFIRLFQLAPPPIDAPNWTQHLRARGEPGLHGRSGQCQRRLMISNGDLHLAGFVILHKPHPTATAGGRSFQITHPHGWFPVAATQKPNNHTVVHALILARALRHTRQN
jgi:hypothetical protein